MHDHDPGDAELRAWLADGKAPAGVCPHCGSRISVVQRNGQFTARCSHRGCGASGPRMATLVRAVEQFCAPPAYVARHMGISVHPSSLTDVVSVLEHDRTVRLEKLEAKNAALKLRIQEIAATTTDQWLRATFSVSQSVVEFSADRVRQYVERELRDGFSETVLKMAGLEPDSFGRGYRVRYDSPLRKLIEEVVKSDAEKMVKAAVSAREKKLPKVLPDKYLKAIEETYEGAYLRELKDCAAGRAEAKARADADEVVGVFGSVDDEAGGANDADD